MEKINKHTLAKILADHKLWLAGDGGRRADLREADLSEACLRWVDLREADLRGACLRWADLREVDLREADLREADLRRACLRWADLREADLREANLKWANISGANLNWTDISGADFNEADLRQANMPNSTLMLPLYHVTWWGNQLAIGCQQHTLEEWESFSDEDIDEMDDDALDWWRTWKNIIFQAVEAAKETSL